MKISCVIGARPQFVKAASLYRSAIKYPVDLQFIHTGQHYDANMSDIFFQELELPTPAHQLNIGGLPQGAMTGRMIEQLEQLFISEKPDLVLVFGDTNSTLAGAIAASKLHIPIAHVESGLRSYNKKMPEEINRIMTDHVSDFLFTPTKEATNNLIKESIDPLKIHFVGDIMMDTLHYFSLKSKDRTSLLQTLQISPKQYSLATIHRAENTKNPTVLKNIFSGLFEVAKQIKIVLPLHPSTKAALKNLSMYDVAKEKLILIDPIGYYDMLLLQKNAFAILTDSGGIQKEAYFFNVPCLTLREETEWKELVDQGCNFLVGSDPQKIFQTWKKLQSHTIKWQDGLYGEGNTSEQILEIFFAKLS